MKISLCLLTYNELDGCKNDIPKIKKIADNFDEIYVVDAGSVDGTVEYLIEQKITIYKQPVPGLNEACHHAFKKSNTDAVIFFHPKGTIPVDDILKFKPLFEEGYEFIIGSRIIKGARNEDDTKIIKLRKWFVVFLALFVSVLFGKKNKILWDVLHGFRGITLDAYKKMNLNDYGKVTIDIEKVCRAYKMNIKSIEFPTIESPRLSGETHFKAIPTGIKLLKYIKREILRKD